MNSISPFSALYRPIGLWTGRLILPQPEERQPDGSVWFEVHNAAPGYESLIGCRVRLKWSDDPQIRARLQAVTRDIQFGEQAEFAQKNGLYLPERLNGWLQVQPLESLAGARLQDHITVLLTDPTLKTGAEPTLVIHSEPIQITGRLYALVTLIHRETGSSSSSRETLTDRFLAQHFNPATGNFDGETATIRIPQVPPDVRGVARFTPQDLEKSPLNPQGWYIYGQFDAEGIFEVQALEPRSLLRLSPDQVRLGLRAAIDYITSENWRDTPAQKGTAQSVLLAPAYEQTETALAQWQDRGTVGDRALVIHLFGGIGGNKAEPATLGLVTGHFSYGIAQVKRCELTGELRWDIHYWQVYGNNPDQIISGLIHWSCYMGDLQRGWMGDRPVSDVIVKLPAIVEDYQFNEITLSPLTEFCHELQTMTARYRTGDGDGAAIVTPATSCVQDSNQALYRTLKRIEAQVQSNPAIQDWLSQHPHASQTWKFEQLVSLGRSLENNLLPLGFVRSDWQIPSDQLVLAGIGSGDPLLVTLLRSLISWHTVLPRKAHDDLARILARHGASLGVLRTNQIGGFDPDIKPLAPTARFRLLPG